MENLKFSSFSEIVDSNLSSGLSCFTIDSFHNTIYAVTKSNEVVSIDKKSKEVKILTFIDHERAIGSSALHIDLSIESDILHIYLENGYILSYSLESEKINCVGFVEEGIAAVSSSPDQESVALISKKDKLFLFTRFFEVLVEKDLYADHSECIQKVDVGWGSKKTQFHGSEGKEAAKITGEPEEPAVAWDDQKKRICWRGDGHYFVTSAIHPDKNYRVLRIWSNEGLLQYESEYVAGLEHSLAWRPEGNLIASSRFHQNVHQIVFFEKNGLRHGQFTLPPSQGVFIIKNLIWSTDSSILLVHGYQDLIKQHIIYLYTERNYHYYLKHFSKFTDFDVELVIWNPSDQLTFSIFTSSGSMKQYKYNWATDYSKGTAAVIDGFKLQITPFDRVNIPPPMSAYSIIFEKPINEIHVHSPEIIISYTCDGELIVFKLVQSDGQSEIPVETNVRNTAIGSISTKILFRLPHAFGLHHLRLISDSSLIAIRKQGSRKDELLQISLSDGKIIKIGDLDDEVLILDYHEPSRLIAMQLADLSAKQASIGESYICDWFNLPSKLVTMTIVDNFHLVGLSREGTLYLDEKPFMKNSCSSFLIHQEKFLISTGNDNLLRCNYLDDYFWSEVLPTGLDPRDEPRSIERRSKLVISIQEDARVILQMPRGNLESIHPRVILLDLLKQLLSSKQFGIAFNMMKRHRINLNLLVDHEFKYFTENVETLISQIGSDVQDICLFLSELSSEQITRSMYKYAYLEECSSSNKLALVCSEMRKVMTQMDPERYFIPILVTFVKDDPPQIGQALKMIFDKGTGKVQDEALRYLNYLIDIEKLYKEALGTYDFDIFLMVAAKSNKDPKEYHAYLNKIRAYENPYYRQFKIDVDLKRNEKALVNMNSLTSDDHRDECLNFIKNNKLFWSAVKIISPTHPWIQSIWEMFADYLLIKRYYEEAGIAYQKAKSITNAIKAYQLSENWQIAIELAFSLEDYDCISLCRLFVTRLLTDNKHLDAAYIQENYLKDKHAAIYTLIKGHHWGEANRLLGMEPSGTKIYNVIKSTLEDELAREAFIFLSVVSEKRSELEAKIDRLKFVEETKQKTLENEDNLVDDEHDLFSDTSSISDSSSVSSNSRSAKSKGDVISLATRKTRHKNKKHLKKYSLKEGSANEDFALRKLIKEMIESCIALTEEAKSLIRWLFFYDKCEDASWCQTDLSALLDFIETQVKIIWPDPEESIQSLDQTPINKIKRAQSLASRCLKDPESFVPPKLTCKPWKLALLQD